MRLSACNFTKNELLHRYFSRILTANFRTPIFQNTSYVDASAEAYSGPCEYNKHFKAINSFHKKLHLRCFTRFCVHLCSKVTSSIYQMHKFKVYCNSFWRHCNVVDIVFACIKETLSPLSDVMLSKNLELLCDFMFATNTKTIIYIT